MSYLFPNLSYLTPSRLPKLSYFFPKFVLFAAYKNARNTLIFNAFRALLQKADSINRPCFIVLLVLRGLVVMAAAPYPRAEASGGGMEGVCFYGAKTFTCMLSYIYIKKRAPSKRPPPCSEGSIEFIYYSRNLCCIFNSSTERCKGKYNIRPYKLFVRIPNLLEPFREFLNLRA